MVGRNFDIFYDNGCLFTHPRDLKKTALIMPPEEPLQWVSQYGSLTFSQVGKEFPVGGINEKGLVVEQNTLLETKYPAVDDRPAVNELQWIQYMLDTCCTVEEVMEAAKHIRISQNASSLHYFVCDPSGKAAILEYINGNLVTYSGDQLPLPVLANSTYLESLEYLNHPTHHQDEYKADSLERFSRASHLVQSIDGKPAATIDDAFQVLTAAKRQDTVWSIVYDLSNMEIHFSTHRQQGKFRISLRSFHFSHQHPAKVANIHSFEHHQTEKQFVDYHLEINRELVQSFFTNETFTKIFQWEMNQEMIDFFASYPDRFTTPVVRPSS
jgi:hypothetical protein